MTRARLSILAAVIAAAVVAFVVVRGGDDEARPAGTSVGDVGAPGASARDQRAPDRAAATGATRPGDRPDRLVPAPRRPLPGAGTAEAGAPVSGSPADQPTARVPAPIPNPVRDAKMRARLRAIGEDRGVIAPVPEGARKPRAVTTANPDLDGDGVVSEKEKLAAKQQRLQAKQQGAGDGEAGGEPDVDLGTSAAKPR